MAKNELTPKEIISFLEQKGFRPVTEEDKKASWYKVAIKEPSCYRGKAPRKPSKKSSLTPKPSHRRSPKKAAV